MQYLKKVFPQVSQASHYKLLNTKVAIGTKMNPKLKEIEHFLTVLGLPDDRVPTFKEYKTAYRNKKNLHPDKAGDESNAVFQEITEAARHILTFLTNNSELQTRKDTDEGLRMMKCFEKEHNLVYNQGSMVFHYDDNFHATWMNAFEKKLGAAKPLNPAVEKNSFQFKSDSLQVSKLSYPLSVTVAVYYQPANGQSKIMIQGKSQMSFMSFVMPEILRDIVSIEPLEQNASLEDDVAENDERGSDAVPNAQARDITIGDIDVSNLAKGFKRLEDEMVNLRVGLVKAVDESVAQLKEGLENLNINREIESLAKAVASNSEELSKLHDKVENVLMHQTEIKPIDVESLDKFLKDGKTVFTKLEDISSIHVAANEITTVMKEVQNNTKSVEECIKDNQNILAKLEEVSNVANVIKNDLTKVSEVEILKTIKENSEKTLPVLNSLENKFSSLVESLNSANKESPKETQAEPSVRPKERVGAEKANNTKKPENESDIEVEVINAKKRGIFYASSIGLRCNLIDLQEKLDSEMKFEKTYHIKEEPSATDLELNLVENMKKLEKESDVDFLIISTGTNDISKLDLNKHIADLNTAACDQARDIVHIANQAAQKYNIDVFIVEKPPRIDDPIRSQLITSSNGMLPSLIMPLEKVHLISLPSLHNLPDGRKNDLFTDGIHLKPEHMKLYAKDIVAGFRKIYPGTNVKNGEDKLPFQKDGSPVKRKSQQNVRNRDQFNLRNTKGDGYSRNHNPNFQPSRNIQNNKFFQQDGWSGNQQSFNNAKDDFRHRDRRGNQDHSIPVRRQNQDSFHPQGNRNHQNRKGYSGQNGGAPAENSQHHHDQRQNQYSQNRSPPSWHRQGQQDEQIPDSVRQYLLNTLLDEGNRRY